MTHDSPADGPVSDDPFDALPPSVSENIETISEFYARHQQELSLPQTVVEKISLFLGSPAYLAANVLFALCWICANLAAPRFGLTVIDPPPFFWLQGLISFNAFIVSSTVLVRQNRLARLADHHAHLDLQVNLLTEKKSSKIIDLLEQLKHSIPGPPKAADPEAQAMSKPADARAVLNAIESEQKNL
jgi:uncharacterized membrane protein